MNEKRKKFQLKINRKYILAAIAILVGLGFCYALFQKPKIITVTNSKADEILQLETKVKELENALRELANRPQNVELKDVSALDEKMDQNQKFNLEMFESKASLSALSHLSERVDRLENDVNDLSKTTSQGALILTAAALTEDAAKRGGSFVFEASVLQELSAGTRIQQSADIIASYALKGILSSEQLIQKFNLIYHDSFIRKQEKAKQVDTTKDANWKEKIIRKLKELIVIKRIKKDTLAKVPDDVYQLVQEGNFDQAIVKMNSTKKYQTENFEIWIEEVRAHNNFSLQIEKIKALTLGTLKAEILRETL